MTKANFLNFVLRGIGRISLGQTATATDTAAAVVVYNAVYYQLQEESLVSWAVDDDLPDWSVLAMKKIMSPEMAREFGVDINKINALEAYAKQGKDLLIKNVNQDYYPDITEAEYY